MLRREVDTGADTVALNPAGEPTTEQIHSEVFNDPAGIYASATSLRDKFDKLVVIRNQIDVIRGDSRSVDGATDPNSTGSDGQDAKVNDELFVQELKDEVDLDEWVVNCWASNGESAVIIQNKSERARRVLFIMHGNPESRFQFTQKLKAQINELFKDTAAGGSWPTTLANLQALQIRKGSRSEQLWGVQTSETQFRDAVEYGNTIGQPLI